MSLEGLLIPSLQFLFTRGVGDRHNYSVVSLAVECLQNVCSDCKSAFKPDMAIQLYQIAESVLPLLRPADADKLVDCIYETSTVLPESDMKQGIERLLQHSFATLRDLTAEAIPSTNGHQLVRGLMIFASTLKALENLSAQQLIPLLAPYLEQVLRVSGWVLLYRKEVELMDAVGQVYKRVFTSLSGNADGFFPVMAESILVSRTGYNEGIVRSLVMGVSTNGNEPITNAWLTRSFATLCQYVIEELGKTTDPDLASACFDLFTRSIECIPDFFSEETVLRVIFTCAEAALTRLSSRSSNTSIMDTLYFLFSNSRLQPALKPFAAAVTALVLTSLSSLHSAVNTKVAVLILALRTFYPPEFETGLHAGLSTPGYSNYTPLDKERCIKCFLHLPPSPVGLMRALVETIWKIHKGLASLSALIGSELQVATQAHNQRVGVVDLTV